jgi:hypothetical protein
MDNNNYDSSRRSALLLRSSTTHLTVKTPSCKMKYNDENQLCITYPEYVECIGLHAYDNDLKRGKLIKYGRGGNGNTILINYEALPPDRKASIKARYGDPYRYIVIQPLNEWVLLNWNKSAFEFYNSGYKLPNGDKLPEGYRDKYTKAVTYLDAIIYYTSDKTALKRDFNIKMQSFWAIAGDVIKAQKVSLPAHETRIKESIKKYKSLGYEFQIEAFRFGNNNSKKVKEQKAEDVLMKLIELDNKHSNEVIAASYNQWAVQNNFKIITPQAVAYRRRNKDHEVIMAREGKSAAYNKYSKQIKQDRPSSPMMLINSDDNVLDLYFKDISYNNGRKSENRYYRPVMYVVMDAYNDYILGYAVGETVTIELVKQAYRNAMAHIEELTGAPYLWHQIKSDKWSIDPDLKGDLATFFKMGGETKFFPAQVAQSKYIERVFGKPLHKILKVFPNYSGANITSQGPNARPNADALQKRSKDFPDKKHCLPVIEMAINSMRHGIVENDKTRQQMWLEAFHNSSFCSTRAITTERKLELVGVKHLPKEPVRLRVNGINFQLNNKHYEFDIPGSFFPEHLNKRVELLFDPADMSKVLVTDNKGIRFVAEAYQKQPSALADYTEGSRTRLNAELEEKTRIADKLTSYVTSRDARLERAKIDAASLIQANVLTKAINHRAMKLMSGDESQMLEEPKKEVSIYGMM